MAALVAAIVIHVGDRTAWLAGMLGTQYSPAGVIAGATIVIVASNALAALGGALLAPELSPNASDLMLALALLAAGLGTFWPMKAPVASPAVGGFLAALGGAGVLTLSDRTVVVTLALAARTPTPALAATGAIIGALVVLVPATVIGVRGRRALPMRAIRLGSGAVLTLAGVLEAFAALRLI